MAIAGKSVNNSPLSSKNELQITVPVERRTGNGKKLVLQGASGNNLKEVDLKHHL